jgi:hypothetical protein
VRIIEGMMPLKDRLWPHEALDRPGEHEQVGAAVRRVVGDDLVGGTSTHSPLIHAYQRSSGCCRSSLYGPMTGSTLNLVSTVSPASQHVSEFLSR